MKSKKEALDDAISATKAAVAEGIVPGGGLALLRCVDAVMAEEKACEGDERTGGQVLRRALDALARQIAENSAVDGGVVVARMLEGKGNYGFDAARKQYVDLVDAGIIDPAKVVRIALENAVSVASVLLLTEATMTGSSDTKKETAALGPRWRCDGAPVDIDQSRPVLSGLVERGTRCKMMETEPWQTIQPRSRSRRRRRSRYLPAAP